MSKKTRKEVAKKSRAAARAAQKLAQAEKPEETKTYTAVEVIGKLQTLCKELGVQHYMLTAVGADGVVLPAVGSDSIGNLLTMKYVSDKEVKRAIEAAIAPAQSGEAQ